MPVRIRLATNGAARNASTEVSMVSLLVRGACFFDRVDQHVEVVQPLFEVSAIVRPKADEPVENLSRDDFPVLRIQPVMRIPQWMNISFGPSDLPLRHFENSRLERCVQIAVRADLNFRIPAL